MFMPLNGGHKWRQADTWSVAKNFAVESPNFMLPRVDMRANTPGIDGMETPWYQYLISIFLRLFHSDSAFFGKFLSLLSGLLLVYIIGRWAAEEGIESKFWMLGMVSVPLFYNYSVRLMPEVFALTFSVVGCYWLNRDFRSPSFKNLFLGSIFLLIGVTARPMEIFWGIWLIWLVIKSWHEKKIGFRYIASGIIILGTFVFWYFIWNTHLRKVYALNYFASDFQHGPFLEIHFTFVFFKGLAKTFVEVFTGNLAFPLLLLGCYHLYRNKAFSNLLIKLVSLVAFFGFLVMIPLAGQHGLVHNYYFMALAPFAALTIGSGIEYLWLRFPRMAVIIGLIVALNPVMQLAYLYRPDQDAVQFHEVAQEIKLKTGPNDVFIVEDMAAFSWALYELRARGWLVQKEQMHNLTYLSGAPFNSAKWVVVKHNNNAQLYVKEDWLKKIQAEFIQKKQ